MVDMGSTGALAVLTARKAGVRSYCDLKAGAPFQRSSLLSGGLREDHTVDDVDHAVRCADVGGSDLGVVDHDPAALSTDRQHLTVDRLGLLDLANVSRHHPSGDHVISQDGSQLVLVLRLQQVLNRSG